MSCTMWSSNLFSASSCLQRFSWSRFFRVQVFKGPGFSASTFFRVQVFLGPGPGPGSGSRFWNQLKFLAFLKPKIYFTEIFHENLEKQFNWNLMLRYTMKLTLNQFFMKYSERNISQCILPFRNFAKFTGKHMYVRRLCIYKCIANHSNAIYFNRL